LKRRNSLCLTGVPVMLEGAIDITKKTILLNIVGFWVVDTSVRLNSPPLNCNIENPAEKSAFCRERLII
jgi:hypothetical protein